MFFDKPGKANTRQTLKAAYERAGALGLDEVVVATSSGETARLAHEIFQGFSIAAVTYHAGVNEPFKPALAENVIRDLASKGIRVVSATHALSGVERALFKKYQGSFPALLIADTLRLFGQGTKVAVEVTLMAADAGALSGADVVAVGGSSRGADTALIVKPAGASSLFDMRIRETVCKPREF